MARYVMKLICNNFIQKLGLATLILAIIHLSFFTSLCKVFAQVKESTVTVANGTFHWARVKFNVTQKVPDKWDISRYGDGFLLEMLEKNTNIKPDKGTHVVTLENLDEMVKYPFLFMTAEGDFSLSDIEKENLKEYLLRGGFLFADDCVYRIKRSANTSDDIQCDYFFQAFKKKIEELFGKKMVKLPNDHDIYHCFYDLPNGLPHCQGVPHGGWALLIDDRMMVFLSSSDIHCGWCSLYHYHNGKALWYPQETSEAAVKMGINIVIYALTH